MLLTNVKNSFVFIITLVIMLHSFSLQADIWLPPNGHKQIPIWPEGLMPDPILDAKPESVKS
jgi:hypothetical protein